MWAWARHRYVVQCNGLEVGMNRSVGQMPKQAPFAIVVGCSDARVPIEMLFGQGFNDLFVIRVAGNVLGDVCMGSIEFALNALSESVKCVVDARSSGLRGRHRCRRLLPRPRQILVHVHASDAAKHHPADLRRRPRVRQRPQGDHGAPMPATCRATAKH